MPRFEAPPPPEPITVHCVIYGCTATTTIHGVTHAENLRAVWRCKEHYRGTWPTTERNQP